MDFALAHDESGCPVEVPAAAAGWLVRRHAGGRGRPGAVYDGDGRPLVVPLETTAGDLRLFGCRAGAYRLDAVDGSRRLLGVAAYTELRSDGGEESEAVEVGVRSDAGVVALARAVEAMQRVQAERERAQAEMLARLIERLAPPVPMAPRNASEVVREYSEVQKHLRKLGMEEDSGEQSGARSALEIVASIVEQIAVVVAPVLQQKWLARGDDSADSAKDADEEREKSADEEGEETEAAEPRSKRPTQRQSKTKADGAAVGIDGEQRKRRREVSRGGAGGERDPGVEKKLAAVFALLTPDEAREVRRISERMPAPLLEQATRALSKMTAEEAVAELRRRFLAGGNGNAAAEGKTARQSGGKGNGPADGTANGGPAASSTPDGAANGTANRGSANQTPEGGEV